MKLTIEITEDDIKRGKRCSLRRCPISLAVKRAYGGYCRVRVYNHAIIINKEGKSFRAKNPKIVKDFITNFDRRQRKIPPKPFSFEADFSQLVWNWV